MRALALVSSLVLTGCSFLFASGPPAQHRQLPIFECTTSRAAPVADTIFGVLQVIGIAITASQSEAEYNEANEVTNGGRDPIIKRNTSLGLGVSLGCDVHDFERGAEDRRKTGGVQENSGRRRTQVNSTQNKGSHA